MEKPLGHQSLLSDSTVQPENTYSYILKVTGQVSPLGSPPFVRKGARGEGVCENFNYFPIERGGGGGI